VTGRLVVLAALASACVPGVAYAQAGARPQCGTILPPMDLPPGQRALVPEDLARLRDIGPAEPQYFTSPFFTLSPDGRWAAFQLRRGDPQRNSYCLAMVLADVTRKVPPRILDEGDEPVLLTIDLRNIPDMPNGVMRVITPRWSPDGKWIAFLKQDRGRIQVWRALADGSGSAPLTHSDVDVLDFRIGDDGSSIIYVTRPAIERERREIEKEGLSGWHYDDRFAPWISKRPFPHATSDRLVQVLDIAGGKVRPPTPEEAALVAADDRFPAFGGAPQPTGVKGLEISATLLAGGATRGSLRAHRPDGSVASCKASACEGAFSPWWMPGHRHVRFRRWEGWAKASSAIYDWDVTSGRVRRLYLTDDLLTSCAPDGESVICLVDSSLRPRRLVRLDPATGKREILFDPNPEFAHLTLGKAERLHWRNAFGIETIADLVLPVGYRAGQAYPMIVVQYDTRGFLRGGTDDEYPIQAFANRGYAVLSFSSPHSPVDKLGAKSFEEVGRLDLRNFVNRRNIQSSLELGVRLAVDRGIADPRRIGITGLSDGSSTIEWALIHSTLFSAAATSSCCWDPGYIARVGPAAARHFLAEGYPGILGREDPFWKDMSLEANARRISTPILVNASEQELLEAVETYTALREAGVPIDMFVYPGEYHGRWQPAHRLATYRRSLDWFDYWLRGIRSKAPDRQAELKEWDRLRREAGDGRPI
jgi:dipeptidyl aminopeptidase/acylaminoacyl peptidase